MDIEQNTFIATIPQGRRPQPKRPHLRDAYRAANYRCTVQGEPMELVVGTLSPQVASLIAQHRAQGGSSVHPGVGAAFITAYNPASLELGNVHNTLADQALRRDLLRLGLPFYRGEGGDWQGKWPTEPSFLVVGLHQEQARELAYRYGQNACLWIDADGLVELLEIVDLDHATRYRRRFPPFQRIEIGVPWGYEWTTLHVTPQQWLSILQGDDVGLTTRDSNDGETFELSWGFRNGNTLFVDYGDDGAQAYAGELTGVMLTLEGNL